jgi:prepilin-type N-terminal cleavage/methylation domain-containing protein
MMFHKLRAVSKDQRGFTLLELLVGILMTAIISSAALATLFQVIAWNSKTNTSLAATTQVQSAVGWISRDVQEAQTVTTSGSDFPLTLYSVGWDGVANTVIYTITTDGQLQRSVNGSAPLVVARYIDSAGTFCSEVLDPITGSDTGLLSLTVKVTVSGIRPTTVTRVSSIFHRTNLS